MYAIHVPTIAGAMRADYATFKRGVMFAILSARVQFPRVPAQCAELEKRKDKAACLWGWKADAYSYLNEHGRQIWRDVLAAPTSETALFVLTRIPGLGIVKGAFVLQMLGHDVACLDVRNIQREGRHPRAYRTDGLKGKAAPAFRRKIARYVQDTAGRASELWDVWCIEVAKDYGSTAMRISEVHLTSIVPRRLRHLSFNIGGSSLAETF